MNFDRSIVRILLTLVLATLPATAQIPLVNLLNASRPGSDFQIGDRFEIVITAAPNQLVSVRTMREGYTDWSPVIGTTDSTGRWSTSGQLEKRDFGGWKEIWTVGSKLASPVIQFSVKAPCAPSGPIFQSGPYVTVFNCETTEGTQTFQTPGLSDFYRTTDGRLINGHPSKQTREQYQSELLGYFMTNGMGATPVRLQSPQGELGDETANLISRLIGVNALNQDETRNLLAILRAAFQRPESIQPTGKEPERTLVLLRHLADMTEPGKLRQEIDETVAYFQAR
ncbi:MAG: hypothetical protein WCD57_03360 [Acidobacteriaceae bacterium]